MIRLRQLNSCMPWNTQGQYELTDFDAEIPELFAAEYATEEETQQKSSVYESILISRILIQRLPQQCIENTKRLLAMLPRQWLSTASPYKFPVAAEAATGKIGFDRTFSLGSPHEIRRAVPPAVDGLETAPVRHKTTVATADMQAAAETYLGL